MAERLWMMSVHGSALILAVLAVRMFLKKYPKEYSYALWVIMLVRLLCPIFIESPMSLWPEAWNMERTAEISEKAVPGDTGAAHLEYTETEGTHLPSAEGEEAGRQEEADMRVSAGTPELLKMVYYSGVLLLAAVFLCRYVRMRRWVAQAVHEMDNIWLCEGISSPFVMGLIKSRIYLPFGISGNERVYVIPHEMMHIRHGDLWVRLLALAALCLHWWNPLVWYGVHKMFQDMEMYCDEAAMAGKSLEARKEYSSAMLEYAVRQSMCAGALSFGQSNTEKRVRNVLKNKKRSAWTFLFIILFGQLCVSVFFTVPKGSGNVQAGNERQPEIVLPDMSGYSEEDMPVHLEEIILSDNMALSSGKSFRVQLVMTEGEYFTEEYAGAGGGIYEENYSGTYELRTLDENGRQLCTCPVQDEFGGAHFNFGDSFYLALDDYNRDGCADFTLGSWGSSSMGLYYLYTILETGEIVLAYPEAIADVGLEFSKSFEYMEPGFMVCIYDNAAAEYSRVPYRWDEAAGEYVGGEESRVPEGPLEIL